MDIREVVELHAAIAAIGMDTVRGSMQQGAPQMLVRGSPSRGIRSTPAQLSRIRRAAAVLNLTSDLARSLRDTAMRQLEGAGGGLISDKAYRSFWSLLNAADVQARAGTKNRATIPAGEAAIARLGAMTLRVQGATKASDLSVRVEPGLPASSKRVSSAWPVAHFVVDYDGALAKNGSIAIDVDVRSLGYAPHDRAVRLLDWDGSKYRDITVLLDAKRGIIRGVTDQARTYVVARIT